MICVNLGFLNHAYQGDLEYISSHRLQNNKHDSLTDVSTGADSQMSVIQESLKTIKEN
jgi:hypothetical protein